MGNICRSPAGEAVMRHVVENEGLAEQIECDSAGTISFHTGNPPDHRMHAAAQNRNIKTGGQARQINQADYNEFDLILTMDEDNYQNVLNMAPAGKYSAEIKRFCDFVAESTANE
ncbi:MAG: low molecular weight phosphotyrosine protein phosphatase, partial [Verrucomicrobiales bacterium]|nr:low molecular weight phosphotyrosine protein phosphatase [Verrucomicrobiales bacterium]